MVMLWVQRIKRGVSTIDDVPQRYKQAVEEALSEES